MSYKAPNCKQLPVLRTVLPTHSFLARTSLFSCNYITIVAQRTVAQRETVVHRGFLL